MGKEPSKTIFVCPKEGCAATFKKPSRLKYHLNAHDETRPYKCIVGECKREYANPYSLQKHVQKAHCTRKSNTPLVQEEFRCTKLNCGKLFKSRLNLGKHEDAHDKRIYACSSCDRAFLKHQHLTVHEFEHTGVLPYKCDYPSCGKAFTIPSKLTRHQKMHEGYTCDHKDCGSKFVKWSELRKHKATAHAKEHICNVCNKNFTTTSNLRIHKAVHELEGRLLFYCPMDDCPKYYTTEYSLKQHVSSKHDGNRLKCPHDDCNQSFLHKCNLKRHTEIHLLPLKKPTKVKKKCRKRKSIASKLSGFSGTTETELEILRNGDASSLNDKGNNYLSEETVTVTCKSSHCI